MFIKGRSIMLLLKVTVNLPKMLIPLVKQNPKGYCNLPYHGNSRSLTLKMLYLACYCHSMTELCFSSTKLSKNFCYASCFNATCRSKPWIINRNFIVSKGQTKSQHGQGMLEVLSDSLVGLVSNSSG